MWQTRPGPRGSSGEADRGGGDRWRRRTPVPPATVAIFETKASSLPPRVASKGPPAVGKSGEKVVPVTYIAPAESTATRRRIRCCCRRGKSSRRGSAVGGDLRRRRRLGFRRGSCRASALVGKSAGGGVAGHVGPSPSRVDRDPDAVLVAAAPEVGRVGEALAVRGELRDERVGALLAVVVSGVSGSRSVEGRAGHVGRVRRVDRDPNA